MFLAISWTEAFFGLTRSPPDIKDVTASGRGSGVIGSFLHLSPLSSLMCLCSCRRTSQKIAHLISQVLTQHIQVLTQYTPAAALPVWHLQDAHTFCFTSMQQRSPSVFTCEAVSGETSLLAGFSLSSRTFLKL